MQLSTTDKKSLLAEHFLLRHLPETALDRIVEESKSVHYETDDIIFRKGDNAETMMVIVKGVVRVSSPSTGGDNVTFAKLADGDVFGEIALIDGHERSANADAAEKTEILEVHRSSFVPILMENPELCIDLLKIVCNRIRHTNGLLEDFSYLDLRYRLAKRLMYLSNGGSSTTEGVNISVRVSKEDLIAMMGVDQSIVESQLTIWTDLGLIKKDNGWLTVNDGDKLMKSVNQDTQK